MQSSKQYEADSIIVTSPYARTHTHTHTEVGFPRSHQQMAELLCHRGLRALVFNHPDDKEKREEAGREQKGEKGASRLPVLFKSPVQKLIRRTRGCWKPSLAFLTRRQKHI